MSMHLRQRMLANAARIPLDIERKDDAGSILEIKKGVEDFVRTFEAFKTKNDQEIADIRKKGDADVLIREESARINGRLDELKSDIEKEVAKLRRPAMDSKGKEISADQQKYSEQFETWFRKGENAVIGGEHALRELEKKAMTINSDTDGGFTVRPELETAIDATLKQVSPMRALASVRQIGGISYKKLVSVHGTTSGWVGETDARPATLGPQLKELDFPAMEIYAMPAVTQTLLDDSFVNIDQWLADEVSLEFSYQENAAFVNGNGVKQPYGFLKYPTVADSSYAWGSVGFKNTGVSGGFATAPNGADCLIDLYHALKTPYRTNAQYLMNNTTLGTARKLKDSNGSYLVNVQTTVTVANGGSLLNIMGKPVVEVPDMPDPGANTFSIAFGDFKRAYLIVDRVGVRVLRDPYTNKPYVYFYTTKRVGGGIQNFEALKLLKFI